MSAQERHRLVGLEPDNLLAFLALLGLLRALDAARPDWRARVFWEVDTRPLRPVLLLKQAQTQAGVAAAAAEGIAGLAEAHEFGGRLDLDYRRDEARKLLSSEANEARAELLNALMSDGAIAREGVVVATPFDLSSGQQHFLGRLENVPSVVRSPKRGNSSNGKELRSPNHIETALFAPWTRTDPTEGFRWDPAEDRRYAHRAANPADNLNRPTMQHGANRLASVGVAALPGTVVRRRKEPGFLNVMCSFGPQFGIQFTWPIWTAPAYLRSVQALLSHPALALDHEQFPQSLTLLSVVFAYRAHRIVVNKYPSVTRADRAI